MLPTKPVLTFCDYIAFLISTDLKYFDSKQEKLLASVGVINGDFDKNGKFLSTKKTINVEDRYGKNYRITIEEI